MAAKTLTLEDAKSANIAVIEDGRGTQAVHDMIVAMQANRRTGSAHTKTRSEVAATGKKGWKQKGTGRARSGGNAPPHWEGGGVAFGPRARDYSKKVNRTTKRLAFVKALSERLKDGDVLHQATFEVKDGKTKSFVGQVSKVVTDASLLVVSQGFDEMTKRAGRNIQDTLLMSTAEVNVEHLLKYDKILLVGDAMAELAGRVNGK
ncbi:MAG TPA: 50S ribosomal protein L4 [Verrucomicrobiales bacterium]|nr:50S ribosomal protein L4 [Verrucomicrobiae bacterium]MCP5554143.1 50S ribosomal protein L4 [Akkermansiaceae bacterium]HRX54310.1 50S ribosomal protein L4 [Verrucomicrobiales bacterium]